jgi:hypothetical protein
MRFEPLFDLILCSLTLLGHYCVLDPELIHQLLVESFLFLAIIEIQVSNNERELLIVIELCLLDVLLLYIWVVFQPEWQVSIYEGPQ